jgi:TP901 family phage tail tape measure protein
VANNNFNISLTGSVDVASVNTSLKKIQTQINPLIVKVQIDTASVKKQLGGLKAVGSTNIEGTKITNATSSNTQLNNYTESVKKATTATKKLNVQTKESAQSVGNMILKFSQWFLIGTLVSSVTRSIRSMISAIVEMDTALTDLKKVTSLTAEGLNDVKERAYDLGTQLGTTATNVVNAVTEFARAGYALEDAFNLAETAITLTNVAENITDAGEAATYLISILKGANLEISQAGKLLDELNEISNNYAVNLGDLADMVQRISGTMTTYGNSIEETMALVTGAYEVLQDERVARGISTLAARIAGLNEDMEVEEGLANNVSKALEKYASIDVFDMNGQLRDTYDILGELASKWDGLTKNAQSVLLNTVAGKQRMDVLSSILTNWESVEGSVETAMQSSGSAAQEQAAYLESIQG